MKHTIPLEQIAEKFAAAANHAAPHFASAMAAQPRARELLLWLQAQSVKEGGLPSFVQEFTASTVNSLGTVTMRKLGGKSAYSAKEIDTILGEIPLRYNQYVRDNGHWEDIRDYAETKWLSENFWSRVETTRINFISPFELPVIHQAKAEFVDSLDRAALQRIFAEFINACLPSLLYNVCTQKDAWFERAWYCDDLTALLIQMMDASAALASRHLAETAVFKGTLDAVEFARQKKTFVRLDGGSRSGKTESVRTIAAMYPGQYRLITTDCMNTDKDFFGRMADDLGMERDYKTTAHRLRMKIDYIARHCGLCFIFDEAHFLFPSVLSKSKRPSRLDWIRTHLVDCGSPVVIVTTPQIYDAAALRLVQVTGYNAEQWDGRIRRHVRLPEKITAADLLAVVQKKAPGFCPDWQQMIAESARLASGSYLAAVQSIIDTTLWLAQSARRAKPILDDLEKAIAETAPNAAETAQAAPALVPTPSRQAQHPLAVKRPRAGRAAADLPAPARSITPAIPAAEMSAPARPITPATATLQPV